MKIITDERDEVHIGKCENCGEENVKGRKIESIMSPNHYYFICFNCANPRVWFKTKDGRIVGSSVEDIKP